MAERRSDDNNSGAPSVPRTRNHETNFKEGNTLDYYNDDLSKKAVNKLVSQLDEDDLYDEYENKASVRRSTTHKGDTSTRNQEYEELLSPKRSSSNYDFDLDEPVRTRPEGGTVNKYTDNFDEDGTEEEYDISIYRNPKGKTYDTLYRHETKPKESPKYVSGRSQKQSPDYEETPRYKTSKHTPYDDDEKFYTSRNKPVPKAKQPVYEDEYYEEYGSNNSVIFYGVIGVAVLFLALTLVFGSKYGKAKKDLAVAQTTIESNIADSKAISDYKIENDDLNNQVVTLKAKVDELQAKVDTIPTPLPTDETTTEDGTTNTTSTTNTNTNTNTNNAGNTTYVVQSGDTLTKISKKFYGNANQYERIMTANGMTNENLVLGATIIIPN